ncbi:aspartate/glutamate racemase family protein [Maridesulfovibrio salexigens]|uniref:Aspartate racemase n=1 Tax=Maridesulfovibrio salexigens (strain ATCC 14822 / DSM 2638 / NCIMB 8403 / VKM B-1763) TaxID=526222 RepID=C6C222_MARSD|nr:aspartate/glutamate racemase family protein [Maridesulfovibrio salexigens]ACS81223.1 aspartate racemase [Maridesulfovibrio salexigens DSM 2638]
MKTLGILGGMSWESTISYYKLLNEGVRGKLGGLHSCRMVMHSVDFAPFAEQMGSSDWESITAGLVNGAKSVEAGGADALIIATNTMHKAAPEVQAAVNIPLLHMADAIAAGAEKCGASKLGLLGTAFTMEQDFLSRPLKEKYGLEVIVPDCDGRSMVHRTIFDELCCGKLMDNTREGYVKIIEEMAVQGAEAIVLGCTEIGLLVKPEDVSVPLIDTVEAHVDLALNYVL